MKSKKYNYLYIFFIIIVIISLCLTLWIIFSNAFISSDSSNVKEREPIQSPIPSTSPSTSPSPSPSTSPSPQACLEDWQILGQINPQGTISYIDPKINKCCNGKQYQNGTYIRCGDENNCVADLNQLGTVDEEGTMYDMKINKRVCCSGKYEKNSSVNPDSGRYSVICKPY